MLFSRVLRVILRSRGQPPRWQELSETKLPPGHKIFDYSPKYYGSIIMCSGVACYFYAQNCLNPESKWGTVYKQIFSYASESTEYISDALMSSESSAPASD